MKYLKVIVSLFFCCGCQTSSENGNSYFDIYANLNLKESIFPLSKIAENIEYIRLETTPQALLRGLNMEIKYSGEFFFINDNNCIYQFDRQGIFIRKFDRNGRGPHEFIQICAFDYSSVESALYLYDNILRKIEVFDEQFQAIRVLNSIPNNINSFIVNANKEIVCGLVRNDYWAQGKQQDAVLVLDATTGYEKYRILSKIPSIKPLTKSDFSFGTRIVCYENKVYYKEYRDDSYYLLVDSLQTDSLVYTFHCGPVPPANLDYDWDKHDQIADYIRFYGMEETSRYIFMCFFPKQENSRLACYDKKDRELVIFSKEKFPWNDFDDGWAPSCFRKVNDTTLIEVIPAAFFTSPPNGNILKNVSEDDNPVLMLIHLKK